MGVSGVCEDGVYGIACHVLLGGLCCECGVDAACTSVVCPGNMCVCGVSVSMGWSCRVSLHGGFVGGCVCSRLLCVARKSHCGGLVEGFVGHLGGGEWGWGSCVWA